MKGKKLLIILLVLILATAVLIGYLIWGREGEMSGESQLTNPTPTVSTDPAHTHDYTQREANPTCTDGGYIVYTCSCGDTYKEDTAAALGHDFGEWETVKPATEEAEGLRQRKCKRCDKTEEETLSKLEASHTHEYNEKVVEPTCTEEGYTYYTCTCGDSYKENTVAALGHAWSEWQTDTKSSCTTSGSRTRTCSACGLSQTEVVSATGHHYGAWTVVNEPTCEETGLERSRCTVCTAEDTRPVAALGHDYEEKTQAPTCTKEGSKTETCKRCGKTTKTTLPPVEHSFGEWISRSPANCTEGGEEYRVCSMCGKEETRTVGAGHNWGDWVLTKPATKKEPGIRERTCKACGEVETMEAFRDHDGHTHEWVETTVEGTCEEAGYIWQTCSYCGYGREKPGSYIPSDNGSNSEGHGWSDWVTTKEPTTTAPGTQERTCRYCGEVQTIGIPQLNEDGTAFESYIDPAVTVEERFTCMKYTYNEIVVRDYRTWDSSISIVVNEDGGLTVVFFNLDGERVEFSVEQPAEGFVRSVAIYEDGTYDVVDVGDPG